jgi:methylornithine synthase
MTAPSRSEIRELCDAVLGGAQLERDGLLRLLAAPDRAAAEPLFAAARALRSRFSGDQVALYGFVYFSTYCRNRCTFCFYRAGNAASPRYRKTVAEVVAICRDLADSGVNLLDLTLGEDPAFHDEGHFEALADLVRAVREAAPLPVMVSPGVVPAAALAQLRAAGADWYALYQETHNETLYSGLRVGQPFADRVAARRHARAGGLLVEDGLLIGVGESLADRADSLLAMRDGSAQQVRVMGLVPQAGTPFAGRPAPETFAELVVIAALRLLMPERLIPASLDVDGIAGLDERLDAGANVVTSIVPPTVGLAGVGQSELDIDEGLRTVAEVRRHLAALGLRQSTRQHYGAWLDGARAKAAVALATEMAAGR